MRTMQAAVVRSFTRDLDVTEVAIPEPGPFQALVRVEYSGVCHTDVHAARGDWPVKPVPPFVPGHEGVGTVVAVGEGVTRVAVGDRVGNAWLATACGACAYCVSGRETLCAQQRNSGYSIDGSFAEHMLVDSRYCPIVPPGVDPAAAAPVLCAGVTVYKGLKVTDTRPGEWVLVSGIGGLGHLAVQYAVAMGRRVVAVDVDDTKLDLALKHGAEVGVNVRDVDDPVAHVQQLTGGVHGALVTAVDARAFPQAVGSLRPGGTVVLVGLPPAAFPLDIVSTVLRGLTVRGSIVGTRVDMAEALDFFARGKVSPTFTVRPLSDVNAVLHELEQGRVDGRVVLDVARDGS
ncbi:alcohol dehydrogenase AdhP [Cellulomonas fimi]|uniref:alcohol dehydrogenase AdhP n=1 Tax=Cellulomonas fimi TaxID=1708 RepID=UPI00234DD3B6|nr:alcohol dehydrogenase AdhP [Cellulomonas fimi]MDC7121331.1 alcohol dehydrogenase AdhP [Cellulomonas fimi]